MNRPIRLPEVKRCSCGRTHDHVPADRKGLTVEARDGEFVVAYWWNCPCESTLYKRHGKIVGWKAPKEAA